jgi:hypothetical protein
LRNRNMSSAIRRLFVKDRNVDLPVENISMARKSYSLT